MSSRAEHRASARTFFALGDARRLSVVKKLCARGGLSATRLSRGARVSRQAIVKHLRVLEGAGLVRAERRGREVLYTLRPERLEDAGAFLARISARWDHALERLRRLVEEPGPPGDGPRSPEEDPCPSTSSPRP